MVMHQYINLENVVSIMNQGVLKEMTNLWISTKKKLNAVIKQSIIIFNYDKRRKADLP